MESPDRSVTFDVVAAVGLLWYGCRLQLEEVQDELRRRHVHLSQATLSNLGDEVLVRYRLWFEGDRPRWAPWVRRGLVLMIDGTSDAGGPTTYRVLDPKRGVTLYAAHPPSENKDDLVACLQEVRRIYGEPSVIIRDQGTAAQAACDAGFPGVPQQACHVHFLRDVGEAFPRDAYDDLKRGLLATRQLARLCDLPDTLARSSSDADAVRRGVRVWTRLLLDHVEGARDAGGGFPFSLAYHEVAVRVRDARAQAATIVHALAGLNRCEPNLLDAKEWLDALGGDERVRPAFLRLDRRRAWYEEVRSLMRLERATLQSRMRPDALTRADRDVILGRVHGIRGEAAQAGPGEAQAWDRVVSRFTAHEPYLWVAVRDPGPERTTNPVEGAHRKTGARCGAARGATRPDPRWNAPATTRPSSATCATPGSSSTSWPASTSWGRSLCKTPPRSGRR